MLGLRAAGGRQRRGCIVLSGGLSGRVVVGLAEVGGIAVERLCGRGGRRAAGCRIEEGHPEGLDWVWASSRTL